MNIGSPEMRDKVGSRLKADERTKEDTAFGTHSGTVNVNTFSEGISTNAKVRDGLKALQE